MIDRAAVQRMVFECFDRLVKIDEDQERKINYLTDDICKRNIELRVLERILNRHIEISKYAPKLSDIYAIQRQLVTEHHHGRIIDFLKRFKDQATNSLGMDNDVFTIKKIIGGLKVDKTMSDNWHWIESEAKELFVDFLQGKIELEESPLPVGQKQLGWGRLERPKKEVFDSFFNDVKNILGSKS